MSVLSVHLKILQLHTCNWFANRRRLYTRESKTDGFWPGWKWMCSHDVIFGRRCLINANDRDEVTARYCAILEQIYKEVLMEGSVNTWPRSHRPNRESQRASGLCYTAPYTGLIITTRWEKKILKQAPHKPELHLEQIHNSVVMIKI